MTGFDSKRQAAQDKLNDEADTLTIVYQRGFADGKRSAERKPLTDELVFKDALRIALGCKDYGGGYRGNATEYEIYQHGIQTVINALRAAQSKGLGDTQVATLYQIGFEATHNIKEGT